MKKVFVLFLPVFLLALSENAFSQKRWNKIATTRDVYASYPERMYSLLQSLDLSRAGLEKVNAAFGGKDIVTACDELLAYFAQANTAPHLRRKQPVASFATNGAADSILQDLFTFYDLTDRVPRNSNGQLDWTHAGPDNDIEWAWGLNRHGHLEILLQAYFETGNPIYAKAINDHVQDWVISSLPYPGVKSSTAKWRGLEVALRAKVWVRVFFALAGSEYFSPATRLLMLTSLPDHTHYMRNFHAQAGNWLTMEMSGLAMVAAAWPEFKKSGEWIAYAKDKMLAGLRDQVYPDGVQKELTSHYHQVALYNFSQFLDICEQAGEPLPDVYRQELEKMHNYIAYSLSPTGHGILNNDSDTRYNRDAVTEAASVFQRDDWLFIASNGKKGRRPAPSPSVVFPWAGQLIMRSGYDPEAHWAFFDIGPWGTGHQHNDKLHLSITAHGRDLLVDGGRFAYRGELADKFRSYARSSASHNVVLVDGAGQDDGPPEAREALIEKYYKVTDRFDYAWNSFDKFEGVNGKANHTRALFYVRSKFWIVVDRIETDRQRKVETLWHWHPDVKVRTDTSGIVSTDHQEGNLKIIPVGFKDWQIQQVQGHENPPQGWYSEKYNHAEPAPATIYSTDIASTSAFVWVLHPSKGRVGALKAKIIFSDSEKIAVSVQDSLLNQWKVIVPFSDSEKASYTYISSKEHTLRPGNLLRDTDAASVLLSRLDLNRRGLKEVRKSIKDPAQAIDALLAYYRSRKTVKHPIDRGQRKLLAGNIADEKDMKAAEDALRHVFIGQGAYPAYYCGDDIDWSSRPVADNEWVWQLNRMGFWDALGRAYWHTGDERYAREWALQLLDWTQKNPRDKEHSYAWRSIEAGIRGYRWTGLFQRFIDSPSFTPDVLVAFLNSCYDHASYLMTQYRQKSNWGLMEAEGMAFIAMTFPEFNDSEKWRTEGIRRLNLEIENQVYDDGHQRELAMGYHTGSIEWFKRTLELAKLNGVQGAFPETYVATIEKMCEIPFKLGLPDGSTTQFGDSWTGEPGRIWPMLKEWGKLFNRPDFLYVASGGKEGSKPGQTAFALKESGFYSMRSGWDSSAICLVLKCGPDGGGHCQPDNGTFELYAGGRHLMPDAGSYIYSSDREGRAWFRQTKVHQTLTLNGENSAYAPALLLWRPGQDADVVIVENQSYPGLTHRRAVIFVDKKYFVIVDEASGTATGDVNIHFQFAPGKAIFDSTRFIVRSDFPEGWNIMVQANKQTGLELREEEGWVSFVYAKKERRPAFSYGVRKVSTGSVRFVTVVAPYEGATPPEITAQLVGSLKPGAGKVELDVSSDGMRKKITFELP